MSALMAVTVHPCACTQPLGACSLAEHAGEGKQKRERGRERKKERPPDSNQHRNVRGETA